MINKYIYFGATQGVGSLAAFVRGKNIICKKIKQMTSGVGETNGVSDEIEQRLISFFLQSLPLSRTLTSNGPRD